MLNGFCFKSRNLLKTCVVLCLGTMREGEGGNLGDVGVGDRRTGSLD